MTLSGSLPYIPPPHKGCGCDQCSTSGNCGCPADMGTGAVDLQRSGLTTPQSSFDFTWYNLYGNSSDPPAMSNPDFGMGRNWLPTSFAYVTEDTNDDSLVFVWAPGRNGKAVWFDIVGEGFKAQDGGQQTLTLTDGIYRLTEPDATVWLFDGSTGLLTKKISSGQDAEWENFFNPVIGRIEESRRTAPTTQPDQIESRLYKYDENNRLEIVTLRRGVSSGGMLLSSIEWTVLRRMRMVYYGTDGDHGRANDLKLIHHEVLSGPDPVDNDDWTIVATEYFRYYVNAGSGEYVGYDGGLKFYVGPENYRRLNEFIDPDNAADDYLAEYADAQYSYADIVSSVNTRRATKAVTEAGTRTFALSYEDVNPAYTPSYNHWKLKTSLLAPDGSRKIVYANHTGQDLIVDLEANPGVPADGRWVDYFEFHEDFDSLVAHATPRALDPTTPYSANSMTGEITVSYNDSTDPLGLIRVTKYYDQEVLPTGGVEGMIEYEGVRPSDPPEAEDTKVRSYKYVQNTINSGTPEESVISLVSEETSHLSTGNVVTEYEYLFHSGTNQISERKVTLPAVPAGQNGQNMETLTYEHFDLEGRIEDTIDGEVIKTAYGYDPVTGERNEIIQNADGSGPTADTTTNYALDSMGRVIEVLGPPHDVVVEGETSAVTVRTGTWTYYRDELQEVAKVSGFMNDYVLFNPVSLTRRDDAGRVTDEIVVVKEDLEWPLATNTVFPQSSWVAWRMHIYDNRGYRIATRVYHEIPASGEGELGANYIQTDFGYNSAGNVARVLSPAEVPASVGPGLTTFLAPLNRASIENPPSPIPPLIELSGLAASRQNAGVLWSHNDGTVTRVNAFNTDGDYLGTFVLSGIVPLDVEDIAIGPGPVAEVDYLYLGDIGRNTPANAVKVYRVVEPSISSDAQNPPVSETLTGVTTFDFTYPEGGLHDAETLLVDPLTRDLYIITKRDPFGIIFRAAWNGSGYDNLTFANGTSSSTSRTTWGDMSPGAVGPDGKKFCATAGNMAFDGLQCLVKSYGTVYYYWRADTDTTIGEMLAEEPAASMRYDLEYKGEAITFDADGIGFFTTSELPEGDFSDPPLHYCARPNATILRSDYDVRGLRTANWVGTNDTGATDLDPDGPGNPSAENWMEPVTLIEYDYGQPFGNGNLTLVTMPVDDTSGNDREVSFDYDYRDRRIEMVTDDGASHVVFQLTDYDNLDRPIGIEWHSGSAGGTLLGAVATNYDTRGRVYSTVFTGMSSGTVEADTWYDDANNPKKQNAAGTDSYTKTDYDPLYRVTWTYVGYAPDPISNPDDPWSVGANDRIFVQTQTEFDEAGNAIKTSVFERKDNTTANDKLTTTNARMNYSGAWFDGINRPIAVCNFGTADFDRSMEDVPPPSSATELVSTTTYNDRGEAADTADPAGAVTHTVRDHAGRVVTVVNNYQPNGSGMDVNITTEVAYNLNGLVSELTAINGHTGNGGRQTTQFTYGTTIGMSESAIASNHLVASVAYPDSTGSPDLVSYKYNRQANQIEIEDQLETVHVLAYDKLGRVISDAATPGTGVNGTVAKIAWAFDVRGLLETVTSLDAMNNELNIVTFSYDQFGQVETDEQDHTGGGGSVPTVAYGYDTTATPASPLRLKSIAYPTSTNGRSVTFDFSTADANGMSRADGLLFKGSPQQAVVSYAYVGLSQIVKVTYPLAPIAVAITNDSGGYPGWDIFNRIIDLQWKSGSTTLARLKYGYELSGATAYRRDSTSAAAEDFGELYGYDSAHRLSDFDRGVLNASDPTYLDELHFEQHWHLDPTCNWKEFEQIVYTSPTSELSQERTHNAVNELTDITESTGPSWFAPVHDAGGNMVEFPTLVDPTIEFKGIYDAWNRLVEVLDDADDPVVSFAYDGLGRRITKDDGSTEQHYFYAGNQVVEEQVSGTAERQFVHGLRGPGDLVLRDRSTGTGLDDERLYALQDAAANVVALGTTTGGVYERYIYDAYGYPTRLSSTYSTPPAAVDWETLYTGLRWDDETELYVAGRYYHSKLGRDLTRNSAGYMGGMNLYAACGSFSLGGVAQSAVVPVIVPPAGPGIPGGGGGGAPGDGAGGGGGGGDNGVPGGPPPFNFPPPPPPPPRPRLRIQRVCVPRKVGLPEEVSPTLPLRLPNGSGVLHPRWTINSGSAHVLAQAVQFFSVSGYDFKLEAMAQAEVVFRCRCIMPQVVCRAGVYGEGTSWIRGIQLDRPVHNLIQLVQRQVHPGPQQANPDVAAGIQLNLLPVNARRGVLVFGQLGPGGPQNQRPALPGPNALAGVFSRAAVQAQAAGDTITGSVVAAETSAFYPNPNGGFPLVHQPWDAPQRAFTIRCELAWFIGF